MCAITALNAHEFLVIERDNRGLGVTNPSGRGNGAMPSLAVVGSKRVFKIDISSSAGVSKAPTKMPRRLNSYREGSSVAQMRALRYQVPGSVYRRGRRELEMLAGGLIDDMRLK